MINDEKQKKDGVVFIEFSQWVHVAVLINQTPTITTRRIIRNYKIRTDASHNSLTIVRFELCNCKSVDVFPNTSATADGSDRRIRSLC